MCCQLGHVFTIHRSGKRNARWCRDAVNHQGCWNDGWADWENIRLMYRYLSLSTTKAKFARVMSRWDTRSPHKQNVWSAVLWCRWDTRSPHKQNVWSAVLWCCVDLQFSHIRTVRGHPFGYIRTDGSTLRIPTARNFKLAFSWSFPFAESFLFPVRFHSYFYDICATWQCNNVQWIAQSLCQGFSRFREALTQLGITQGAPDTYRPRYNFVQASNNASTLPISIQYL